MHPALRPAILLLGVILLLHAPVRAQEEEVLFDDGTETTVEDAIRAEVFVDGTPEIGRLVTLRVTLPEEFVTEDLAMRFPPETGRRVQLVGTPQRLDERTWSIAARPLVSGPWRGVLVLEGTDAAGEAFVLESHPLPGIVAGPMGELDNPRDYTGLLAAPPNPLRTALFGLFVALGIGLVALLGWLLWKRLRAARAAADAIEAAELDPLWELSLALQKLGDLVIYRTQGTKAHYSILSESLRRYLERQLGVSALEMTEDEVVEYLAVHHASNAPAQALAPVLANASAAKFAKWESTEDAVQRDLDRVSVFARSEKERRQLQRASAESQRDNPEAA